MSNAWKIVGTPTILFILTNEHHVDGRNCEQHSIFARTANEERDESRELGKMMAREQEDA